MHARQAGDRHRREHAGDETADVPELRDVVDREREHEVQHDDADERLKIQPQFAPEDQCGTEQPENRTRRTDLGGVDLTEREHGGRTADRAEQVQGAEAPGAEEPFDGRADHGQGQHVRADVQQAHVQERRGDQPVVAAVGVHHGRGQLPGAEQRRGAVAGLAEPADRLRGRHQVDDHVHGDEADRHPREGVQQASPKAVFGGRVVRRASSTSSGQWKPTEAGRMQSGQMKRSQRVQRMDASRFGCR